MKNEFDRLSLKSIQLLVDLLIDTNSEDLGYIRRRFEENARGFDSTVNFLAALNLLEYDQDILNRTQELQKMNKQVSEEKSLIVQYLIELIFDSNNAISIVVKDYLSKFNLMGDALVYKPRAKIRRDESGIRNLLIEFGIVGYMDSERLYYITDEYLPVIVKKTQGLYHSQNELEFINNKQKEIGCAAELEVLKFEKKRLENRPELVGEVQLISQKNANAGYDILSCEFECSKKNPIFRYIEVKAVSLTDLRFFWTRNEIEVAKNLGERYYLYLLPVLRHGVFDILNLKVISNAYKNIFISYKEWKKTEELYSFRKVSYR